MSTVYSNGEGVDPDPVITGLLIVAGAAAILQLKKIFEERRDEPPPPPMPNMVDGQRQQLANLEGAVENIEASIKRICRSVERGSPDSEAQFFDAPLRVSKTTLVLDGTNFDEYNQHVNGLASQVGMITFWIGLIIKGQPDLAYRLGERMGTPLERSAEHLNSALAIGSPTRDVVAEARGVLAALANAIEKELSARN